MNILFFSHYFPPEGNAPAARTHENCRLWANQGHSVTVITCAPNVPSGIVYDGYKNKLLQRETIDGINVVRLWTYIAPNKGTIKRILNYLSFMLSSILFSLFVKKPDVIIATSPQFFCGWAGVIASRIRRVPFILEIRDLWPESIQAVDAIRNKKILHLLEWLEIKMYSAADLIVTVGNGYKSRLIEKNVPKEKISVIPNGIDPEFFSPAKPDKSLQQKFSLSGKFVCSYIGTIGMACGLEIIINAAALLKKNHKNNIAFLLIGDGASKDNLHKIAKEQNLDNIIFAGRQNKKLIPAFLSVSDACLVHLKKTELFQTVLPSKIFEAAAMEKPVILGVEGSAAQLLQNANAGICIEPENANQLADAILTLAANPNLAASLGRNGRNFVIQHHNRNILADKYLHLINSLCKQPVLTETVVLEGK